MEGMATRFFHFRREVDWSHVFKTWRDNEDYQGSHWHRHYTSRGFDSWEDWRLTYVYPLDLQHRLWFEYTLTHPLSTVPDFYAGPFLGWRERYYTSDALPTFASLIQHPAIQQRSDIGELVHSFPKQTTIIGMLAPMGVVIVEGMHRSCALALASYNNIPLHCDEITILLTLFPTNDIPFIGKQVR